MEYLGYSLNDKNNICQHQEYKQINVKDLFKYLKNINDEINSDQNEISINDSCRILFILCNINYKDLIKAIKTQDYLKKLLHFRKKTTLKKNKKDIQVKGLVNIKNSCYMDSVFMSLFFNRNNYINDMILYKDTDLKEIQDELISITSFIRNENKHKNKNVTTFRKIIKKYKLEESQFHTGREQDTGEFLQYLFI
jgi:ubiquitin C-terminal hydrolase